MAHKDDLLVKYKGMVPNSLNPGKKKMMYGGQIISRSKVMSSPRKKSFLAI